MEKDIFLRIYFIACFLLSLSVLILYSINTDYLLNHIDFIIYLYLPIYYFIMIFAELVQFQNKQNSIIFPGGLSIVFLLDIVYASNDVEFMDLPGERVIYKFLIYSQLLIGLIHLCLVKHRPFFSLKENLVSSLPFILILFTVIVFNSNESLEIFIRVISSIVFGFVVSYLFLNFEWFYGIKEIENEGLIN